VRLVVNGEPLQHSFDILKDSRLTHVTAADIAAELQLDLAVRNATNDANQNVINIRACTAQVDDRVAAANDPAVTQAGISLDTELNAVHNELHESRNVGEARETVRSPAAYFLGGRGKDRRTAAYHRAKHDRGGRIRRPGTRAAPETALVAGTAVQCVRGEPLDA
jgi:hypothetical protein